MLRTAFAILSLSLLSVAQTPPIQGWDVTGVLGATTGGTTTSEESSPQGGARGVKDETCWEDGNGNRIELDINGATHGGTDGVATNSSGDSGHVGGDLANNGGMANSNGIGTLPDGSQWKVRGGIVLTRQASTGAWDRNTRTSCNSDASNPNPKQRGIDNGTVG